MNRGAPGAGGPPAKRPRAVAQGGTGSNQRYGDDSFYDAGEDELLSQACVSSTQLPGPTHAGPQTSRVPSSSFWGDATDAKKMQAMRAEANRAKGQLIQLQKKLEALEKEKRLSTARIVDARSEVDYLRRQMEDLRRSKEEEMMELRKQIVFEKEIAYADILRKDGAQGTTSRRSTTPQFPPMVSNVRKVTPRMSSTETKEFFSRLPKARGPPDSSHAGHVFDHTQNTPVAHARVAQVPQWGPFTVDDAVQTDPEPPPERSLDKWLKYNDVLRVAIDASSRIIGESSSDRTLEDAFRPVVQLLNGPNCWLARDVRSKRTTRNLVV